MVLALPATAQPLTYDGTTVGEPLSNRPAELYMPAGARPFPAVVVLHDCGGIVSHDRIWARQLAEWGYVSLLLNSFGPRGQTSICNHGNDCAAGVLSLAG